mgnify:CR=1 FL=1
MQDSEANFSSFSTKQQQQPRKMKNLSDEKKEMNENWTKRKVCFFRNLLLLHFFFLELSGPTHHDQQQQEYSLVNLWNMKENMRRRKNRDENNRMNWIDQNSKRIKLLAVKLVKYNGQMQKLYSKNWIQLKNKWMFSCPILLIIWILRRRWQSINLGLSPFG